MSTLTAAQIGAYAAAAGFTGTGLRNAIAVALAESGGRTTAVGVNADRWRSRDRGLWQINDHWHPEVSDAAAFNPASAAAAAFRISSHGANWSAWSTWHNGTAQAQFGRAQIAANQAQAGGGGANAQNVGLHMPSIPSVLNPLDLLGNLLGAATGAAGDVAGSAGAVGSVAKLMAAPLILTVKAGAWIADAHNWTRVLMVTGGGVGILLALDMIAKSGAAGSTAESVAAIPRAAAKQAAKAGTALATDGASLAATGA